VAGPTIFDSQNMHFLTKQDYLLYLKIRRWACRIKGTTGKATSYFHPYLGDKWTFRIPDGPVLVRHWHYATPNYKIIKVKGTESPYSGDETYWTKRISEKPDINTLNPALLQGATSPPPGGHGLCPYPPGPI
jgi:RNA-directed DNA polymerase